MLSENKLFEKKASAAHLLQFHRYSSATKLLGKAHERGHGIVYAIEVSKNSSKERSVHSIFLYKTISCTPWVTGAMSVVCMQLKSMKIHQIKESSTFFYTKTKTY